MNFTKKFIISTLILFFILNCGGEKQKKIYKEFDTIEVL